MALFESCRHLNPLAESLVSSPFEIRPVSVEDDYSNVSQRDSLFFGRGDYFPADTSHGEDSEEEKGEEQAAERLQLLPKPTVDIPPAPPEPIVSPSPNSASSSLSSCFNNRCNSSSTLSPCSSSSSSSSSYSDDDLEKEPAPEKSPAAATAAATLSRESSTSVRSRRSFSSSRRPRCASGDWEQLQRRATILAERVGAALPPNLLQGAQDSPLAKVVDDFCWLEVVDPKHRFGANLMVYFTEWERLQLDKTVPFFTWLDKSSELPDLAVLPREKLEREKVMYLDKEEREDLCIVIRNGLFFWNKTGEPLTTGEGEHIFVRSMSGQLYLHRKENRRLHHTSFLAGAPVLAAGRMVCRDGQLIEINLHSGHYRLGEVHVNVMAMLQFLHENGINLNNVTVDVQRLMRVARDTPSSSSDVRKKAKKHNTALFLKADSAFWFLNWKQKALSSFLPDIVAKGNSAAA